MNSLAWEEFPSELETLAISGSSTPNSFQSRCVVTPIVTSSTFMLRGSGAAALEETQSKSNEVVDENPSVPKEIFEYSRHGNPTRNHLEKYFAQLEGSQYAVAFGSGMAALGSIIQTLEQGDHILSSMAVYGGSYGLFQAAKRFGITVDFFYGSNTDEILSMIKPNTKMIYLESPSNPVLRLLDIAAISSGAHKLQPINIVIDNTFLTPVLQRCLVLGVDTVIYSTSKYIGGHADIIGGMVTTNSTPLFKKIKKNQEVWGAVPSPFDCYLTIRSLKTLHLRLEKHSKNAMKVARFLESHKNVDKVVHPGLQSHPQHDLALKQQLSHCGMIGFYISGGFKEADKFLASVQLIRRAPSLGADISLVTIPAKMSHIQLSPEERQKIGITDNFIRLSIGLEKSDDLLKDLDQALKKACS